MDGPAVDLVELSSTVTMVDTIWTARLIIEQGGQFNGRCKVGNETTQGEDGNFNMCMDGEAGSEAALPVRLQGQE